jgi:hypothetical protein
MAMTAWQSAQPTEAMLAAYASDPALAAMRVNFTDVVRRTAEVTASGLLARQEQRGPAVSRMSQTSCRVTATAAAWRPVPVGSA